MESKVGRMRKEEDRQNQSKNVVQIEIRSDEEPDVVNCSAQMNMKPILGLHKFPKTYKNMKLPFLHQN